MCLFSLVKNEETIQSLISPLFKCNKQPIVRRQNKHVKQIGCFKVLDSSYLSVNFEYHTTSTQDSPTKLPRLSTRVIY